MQLYDLVTALHTFEQFEHTGKIKVYIRKSDAQQFVNSMSIINADTKVKIGDSGTILGHPFEIVPDNMYTKVVELGLCTQLYECIRDEFIIM